MAENYYAYLYLDGRFSLFIEPAPEPTLQELKAAIVLIDEKFHSHVDRQDVGDCKLCSITIKNAAALAARIKD